MSSADATNVDLAPLGADATSEIEAIDILSVRSVRTLGDDDSGSDVLRTTEVERITPSEAVKLITPPPSNRAAQQDRLEPLTRTQIMVPKQSSIAPVSLDLYTSMSPMRDALPTVSTTLELAGVAGIPRTSPRLVMFATTVFALCLVAGAVGAVLGYERDSNAPQVVATTGTAFHAPRAVTVVAAREEVTIGPPSAPEKATAAPAAPLEVDELTDSPAPAPVPTVATAPNAITPFVASTASPVTPSALPSVPSIAAPIPAPAPRAVAAPAPAVAHGTTGVLHVSGSPPGALVDGAPHRIENGQIVLACGHHHVKVPGHGAHDVNIPCDGATTF